MENILIRLFEDHDAEAAARIFFDAVHQGTRKHYDQAQRKAWAAQIPDTTRWCERLCAQMTFVAEHAGKPVGFMTLKTDGYIDLAFVAPETIGKGVGRKLYDRVEAEALRLGCNRLHAEASFQAKAFFQRQGWVMIKQQSVHRGSVVLTNFLMEKVLR